MIQDDDDGDDDNQTLLLDKIRVLLWQSLPPLLDAPNERRLVALTLLTRTARAGLLPPTADGDGYHHHPIWDGALLEFTRNLLLGGPSPPRPLPVRLVAQLLHRTAAVVLQDEDDDDNQGEASTALGDHPHHPPSRQSTSSSSRTQQGNNRRTVNALGEALLQCFCGTSTISSAEDDNKSGNNDHAAAVARCEVLIGLSEWLNLEENADRLDAALERIWRATARSASPGVGGNSNISEEIMSTEEQQQQEEEDDDDPAAAAAAPAAAAAQELMDQTLTALLDQTSLIVHHSSASTMALPAAAAAEWQFQLELAHLWLRHGVRVAQQQQPTTTSRHRLPSFWRPLLGQWLRPPRTPAAAAAAAAEPSFTTSDDSRGSNGAAARRLLLLREKQAEALLLILQTYCGAAAAAAAHGEQPSSTSGRLFGNDDDDDDNLAWDVTQLILACAVSVGDRSDGLRVLAWMTVTALVRSASGGWEWLLVPPSQHHRKNKNRLGALVRLAAGEWKIQLAALLVHRTDGDGDDDDGESGGKATIRNPDDDDSSPGLLLVEVCAQFLLLTVDYLLQLSDRMDDDDDDNDSNANIPGGDVILHVRKSLNGALDSAVQYLGLTAVRIPAVDGAVVRVLAKLLAEFDVFAPVAWRKQRQQQPPFQTAANPEGDDGSPECAALQALHVAMEIATKTTANDDDDDGDGDADLIECLLPSVAAILASAEGEPSRVALLKEYGLLGDHLHSFLERFWQSDGASDAVAVSWACQVIELWVSVDRICEVSRIQTVLVRYLQRMLGGAASPELVNALSSVVGCYVTLQGDEPPGKPDATILQQVLEVCARQQDKR